MQEPSRIWFAWFVFFLSCLLSACGGGSGSTQTQTAAGETLVVNGTLADGSSTNRFAAGSALSLSIRLTDSSGKPIQNAVVGMTANSEVAQLTPASGKTLTDANGAATATLTGVKQGVDVLSISAVFTDSKGAAKTLTASLTYEVLAGSTPTTTPSPSVKLAFTGDNRVATGAQSTLEATVLDGKGQPVQNTLVTFKNDDSYATFNPAAGTALTDSKGKASIGMIGTSKQGADKVTVTAVVPGSAGVDETATASLNYQVVAGAAQSKPSITLALVNTVGQAISSVSYGKDAQLLATLRDANGSPVSNTSVNFEADTTTLVQLSALTDLTDASGVANTSVIGQTVTIDGTTTIPRGVVTLTATATLNGQPVSGTLRFSYIPPTPTPQSLRVNYQAGSASLPAGGSVGVSVNIVDTASNSAYLEPISVAFTSACVLSGRARLTTPAININGVATATYTDLGCSGSDTLTATVVFNSQTRSTSGALALGVATPSSLTFVDANPSTLGVKGSGTGEISQVRFKLVDANGNPLSGRQIDFRLLSAPGGAVLNTSAAQTDANGLTTALLQSGTVGAPLTVIATLHDNTAIWTQSAQLYVSTRIPHQNGFSPAVTTINPEFLDHNGEVDAISVHLSDRFGNPVPDGTVVNFRTEGGVGTIIDPNNSTAPVGGCITKNALCTVNLISGGNRLAINGGNGNGSGRQSVLAYAVGEDSFSDENGDGLFSVGDFFPPFGTGYLAGEAFVDANFNGSRENGEEFIDFNGDGLYNGPDGLYRGLLCGAGANCSSQTRRHVYANIQLIWSGSRALFELRDLTPADTPAVTSINLTTTTACPGGGGQVSALKRYQLRLTDVNGNILPAGTTVALATANGKLDTTSTTFTVPNSSTVPTMTILIQGDKTLDPSTGACATDTTSAGALTVTVTTPKGIVSTQSYDVVD